MAVALAVALGAAWLARREEASRPRAPSPAPLASPARPPESPLPRPEGAAPQPAASIPGEPTDPAPPLAEELRAWLEAAIAEKLPDRKLSSDQLDAATDALLRLRAARREMRALPRTPENARRREELREALGEASADFEYVVELDPAEFTELVEGERD